LDGFLRSAERQNGDWRQRKLEQSSYR
jgi:hypothetical protein